MGPFIYIDTRDSKPLPGRLSIRSPRLTIGSNTTCWIYRRSFIWGYNTNKTWAQLHRALTSFSTQNLIGLHPYIALYFLFSNLFLGFLVNLRLRLILWFTLWFLTHVTGMKIPKKKLEKPSTTAIVNKKVWRIWKWPLLLTSSAHNPPAPAWLISWREIQESGHFWYFHVRHHQIERRV